MWAGPTQPTFTPRQQPGQESCIDHLTIWYPKRISRETVDTVTVQTAFLDHLGGGCWLAYKKLTSWTPLVSPLTLPHTCHNATKCAFELALDNGIKAPIISCYLPQKVDAHSLT